MGPRVRGDDERVVCSIIVIASGAKQSIARHRQIEDGLLRRFASRNDDAVVPAKAGTHTPRPRGLARWLTLLLQETLVVMGPRVRGDDERVVCSPSSSLRAERSNPSLGIARSKMDCFVASLLAMTTLSFLRKQGPILRGLALWHGG